MSHQTGITIDIIDYFPEDFNYSCFSFIFINEAKNFEDEISYINRNQICHKIPQAKKDVKYYIKIFKSDSLIGISELIIPSSVFIKKEKTYDQTCVINMTESIKKMILNNNTNQTLKIGIHVTLQYIQNLKSEKNEKLEKNSKTERIEKNIKNEKIEKNSIEPIKSQTRVRNNHQPFTPTKITHKEKKIRIPSCSHSNVNIHKAKYTHTTILNKLNNSVVKNSSKKNESFLITNNSNNNNLNSSNINSTSRRSGKTHNHYKNKSGHHAKKNQNLSNRTYNKTPLDECNKKTKEKINKTINDESIIKVESNEKKENEEEDKVSVNEDYDEINKFENEIKKNDLKDILDKFNINNEDNNNKDINELLNITKNNINKLLEFQINYYDIIKNSLNLNQKLSELLLKYNEKYRLITKQINKLNENNNKQSIENDLFINNKANLTNNIQTLLPIKNKEINLINQLYEKLNFNNEKIEDGNKNSNLLLKILKILQKKYGPLEKLLNQSNSTEHERVNLRNILLKFDIAETENLKFEYVEVKEPDDIDIKLEKFLEFFYSKKQLPKIIFKKLSKNNYEYGTQKIMIKVEGQDVLRVRNAEGYYLLGKFVENYAGIEDKKKNNVNKNDNTKNSTVKSSKKKMTKK